MGCDDCQTTFDTCVPLALSVSRSGGSVRVWAQNQSKSIIYLKRFLVCRMYTWGSSVGYYRPESYIEQGVGSLIHSEPVAADELNVQVQAEYFEVDGRSVSNCLTL